MSSDLWRWADPDGQQRRVRIDELRAALAGGLIAPNTPVWKPGWVGWQSAQDVAELTASAAGGANGVLLNIPPPPLAVVAVQHEFEAKAGVSVLPPSGDEEPPPPPAYVPLPVKAASIPPPAGSSSRSVSKAPSASLPTEIGGSPAVMVPPPGPKPPGPPPRLGPSLPTTIGIAPPPELVQNVKDARSKSAPSPSEMIEELSGSMLLDEASNPSLDKAAKGEGKANGLPAPTDPVVSGEDLLDDIPGLTPMRRPGLSLVFDDLREIRAGRPPKNKLLIGVLAVVGLSGIIMILALVVSAIGGGSSSKTSPAASASVVLAVATPTTTVPAADRTTDIPPPPPKENVPPPAAAPAKLGDCSLGGEAKVVAPRAVVGSGIEALPFPNGVGLGFASNTREAVAASIDPATGSVISTVRSKSPAGDTRKVAPIQVGGKLALVADFERKNDKLANRRSVTTSPVIDVGVADNAIVWAPHGKESFAKLFALEGEGPVEALRAVPLSGTKGVAIAFRRGNGIFVGIATGDATLTAEGNLSRIAGLGPQVGAPALTATGDRVVVAWADRAAGQESWQIRWTKTKIGAKPDEATTFTLPDGGLGGQAMAPALASLGGGRFLLAWTEGPVSNHQVRAMTMSAEGTPSGSAMSISAQGANAGQPAAAVSADGRGVVAYLASKGKNLELYAAPVNCSGK